ncbi:MAG: hypothetical protein ACRBCJ_06285 [Hyphomicrobiaceae bacterium]
MKYIVIWAGISFLSAVIAGYLCARKNRDYSYWMAWCFIVPPAVLVLLMLPVHKGERPRRPTLDEEDRRPFID